MPPKPTGQVTVYEGKRGRTYGLRFRAYGDRHSLSLGRAEDGWTRARAEEELANVLADVRRGIWQPARSAPVPAPDAVQTLTFHRFASQWFKAKEHEISQNTARSYRNDLTNHLLPFFQHHLLPQITIAEVDRYRNATVRDGELKARTINMHLALLAQILEQAVEYGHIEKNPASGRRRRLKAQRPRPVHLDTAAHLAAVLEAASLLDEDEHARTRGRRAAFAVMLFAGLRAEEVGALRWRDIDLANGRIHVGRSKTSAGVREVDLLPILRDELLSLKTAVNPAQDDVVFVTSTGKPRDRHNLRQRVVGPVVKKADELLAERDERPLPAGLSPHKLRHTFASLLVALGNDPAYVMGQLGHTDPAFTLRVYTHMMRRDDGERCRLRALVDGDTWTVPEPEGAPRQHLDARPLGGPRQRGRTP